MYSSFRFDWIPNLFYYPVYITYLRWRVYKYTSKRVDEIRCLVPDLEKINLIWILLGGVGTLLTRAYSALRYHCRFNFWLVQFWKQHSFEIVNYYKHQHLNLNNLDFKNILNQYFLRHNSIDCSMSVNGVL